MKAGVEEVLLTGDVEDEERCRRSESAAESRLSFRSRRRESFLEWLTSSVSAEREVASSLLVLSEVLDKTRHTREIAYTYTLVHLSLQPHVTQRDEYWCQGWPQENGSRKNNLEQNDFAVFLLDRLS